MFQVRENGKRTEIRIYGENPRFSRYIRIEGLGGPIEPLGISGLDACIHYHR